MPSHLFSQICKHIRQRRKQRTGLAQQLEQSVIKMPLRWMMQQTKSFWKQMACQSVMRFSKLMSKIFCHHGMLLLTRKATKYIWCWRLNCEGWPEFYHVHSWVFHSIVKGPPHHQKSEGSMLVRCFQHSCILEQHCRPTSTFWTNYLRLIKTVNKSQRS